MEEQRHTGTVRSEKCVGLRSKRATGMRLIAALFGLCTPEVLISHVSVFSRHFKMLEGFTKLATSSSPKAGMNPFSVKSYTPEKGVCIPGLRQPCPHGAYRHLRQYGHVFPVRDDALAHDVRGCEMTSLKE